MDKGKLAALSREGLIDRAETLGVRRARFLTRPELVDEILMAETKAEGDKRGITRGFVGLARDLLARLVERGLHLPDAAERIRGATPPPRPQGRPSSIPTVTLAEIYASQGHVARAVDTLRRLLVIEPDHEEAREMLARFEVELPEAAATDAAAEADAPSPVPPAVAPTGSAADAGSGFGSGSTPAPPWAELEAAHAPEAAANVSSDDAVTANALPESMHDAPVASTEPLSMLDDAPLPPRYDVDECVALPVDPRTVFVYWELREDSLRRVAARLGIEGVVALRVAVLQPSWDGPTYARFDCDVYANLGEYFLRGLPEGAVVRVAAGYRAPSGEFTPLAHSELFEAALAHGDDAAPVAPKLFEWTLDGLVPVERRGNEAAFLAEALHASKAPGLESLALQYGASALATWRQQHGSSEQSPSLGGSSEQRLGGSSELHLGSSGAL